MPAPFRSSYDVHDQLAVLYDRVQPYATRSDVPFYVEEASRAKDPVLELGCGTGRVLLPIARAGLTVAGVDSSRVMLARCREKLVEEPGPLRSRVTLHEGDARDVDLGETFALVIAPFRLLQLLPTIDEQLRFLHAVARHLVPGGRFVFDVFNPRFQALVAADGTEREDTPEQRLDDGRSFRRTARVTRVRWLDQVSEVELIYYLRSQPDGRAERIVQPFDMRWYLHAELTHLLARCGFREVSAFGDFRRSPLHDDSPEQVICAERI